MEETIDYQALYEGVRAELEQARLTILKMRYARNPLDHLDMDKARGFVQKNYLLIIVALYALSLLPALVRAVEPLITKRRHFHA